MVRFIVHAGYGKTGTSLLQQKLFPALRKDVLYLGKTSENMMINSELDKLLYTVFPSLIEAKEKNEVRARNSLLLIPSLGDALLKFINGSKKKIFILSNECIFDYSAYNAELNQFLLKKLFDYMQTNYNGDIKFKVMMTIRNQGSILKSFYAYQFIYDLKDYVKSFENFIHYGLKHKHMINFGGYHYDLVLDNLSYLFGLENVKFFLYEKIQKDGMSFVGDVLDFIEVKKPDDVDSNLFSVRINSTSNDGLNIIRGGVITLQNLFCS